MDVFEKMLLYCFYVLNDKDWIVIVMMECIIVVCVVFGKGGYEVCWIGLDGILLMECGKGINICYINNIVMENEDYCDSFLVIEVFIFVGYWLFYLFYCYDEDDFLWIIYFEEIYYYCFNFVQGFGIQWVYIEDGQLDEIMVVVDGDVVLVLCGYYFCGVFYGFEMYYLNVMVGLCCNWCFVFDFVVEWIMECDV